MTPDAEVLKPSFAEAVRIWLKIGLLSFGGPAGQIALTHRIIVEERRWLRETEFLHALNFCMLLPGPEAMQLVIYAGWRLHGRRGGLAAGLLFMIPGTLVILILSLLYALYGKLSPVTSAFIGIKAAVLSIVIEALLRVARRALKSRVDWLIAAAAFLCLFWFHLPFPAVIVGAAVLGFSRPVPPRVPTSLSAEVPAWHTTVLTLIFWIVIWLAPAGLAVVSLGIESVYSQVALFFSKMSVVTFGGAYAILAYMAQQAVEVYAWLTAGEMVDGLGLAETTPGPLILVTEFVGFLAGYRTGGSFGGLIAALLTLWATFVPSFFMIFLAAPYLEWLRSIPRLSSALAAVTSAVVGVIFNLSLWFGLHVLFSRVETRRWGVWFDVGSANPIAIVLAIAAGILLFGLRWGIVPTLAVCGGAAFVLANVPTL